MLQLVVENEVVDHQEASQRLDIDVVGKFLTRFQCLHEGVEFLFYEFFRQFRFVLSKFGLLHIHGNVVIFCAESIRLVVTFVGVEFEHRGMALVVEVDAVVRQADFLREIIVSVVIAVDVEFDGHDVVGSLRSHETGRLHSDGVARQRTALFIGQKHPVFAVGEAERLVFLVEFDAIGILVGIAVVFHIRVITVVTRPRRISATFDVHRRRFQRWEHARAVDGDVGVEIVVFARNHQTTFHVDIHRGNVLGLVGQPVDVDAIVPSEGFHLIAIFSWFEQFALLRTARWHDFLQLKLGENHVEPVCSRNLVQI